MTRRASLAVLSVLTLALAGIIMRGRVISSPQAGATIYREWGCGSCHGDARQGTATGPNLQPVAHNWRREDLARYLRDPDAFRAANPRLQLLAKHYRPVAMPAIDGLSQAELNELADYILNH